MKKILPFMFSIVVFLTLIIIWETYVTHWEKTQHTGGAVIRVDVLMIYPLSFLVAVGVFLGVKYFIEKFKNK